MNEPSTATAKSEPKRQDTDKTMIFYGVTDIAQILSCSIPTARDIMHRADFPLILVGRTMLVYKGAFEQWAMTKRT